jgi:hypothetical protein
MGNGIESNRKIEALENRVERSKLQRIESKEQSSRESSRKMDARAHEKGDGGKYRMWREL